MLQVNEGRVEYNNPVLPHCVKKPSNREVRAAYRALLNKLTPAQRMRLSAELNVLSVFVGTSML